jgi:uncharacterized protein (DUF433 family)
MEMSVNWREHIVCDPAILCGKPTLKGTRLSVEFVLDLLASGFTRKDIDENYPNLSAERVHAALAFASDTVRQTGKSIFFADPQDAQASLVEFRLAKGTCLQSIPNLNFMLQLMACLESVKSALRWLQQTEDENSVVRELDHVTARFAGIGWCFEAFELLREGNRKGIINRTMLGNQEALLALLDRIAAKKSDDIITRVRDIRNKYFGHFDLKVMQKFIAFQQKIGAPEPFFLRDAEGTALGSRFTWPMAAFMLDFLGDLNDPQGEQEVDRKVEELYDICSQTANLLQALLDAWLHRSGLSWEGTKRR